jgi:hypothetical protein
MTRPQFVRVGPLEVRVAASGNLEHRKIGRAVDSDQLGSDYPSGRRQDRLRRRVRGCRIGEQHLDAGGSIDDVGIGDDVAVRIDDHARPAALLTGQERVRAGVERIGRDLDLDHGRRDALSKRLEGGAERRQVE